MNMNKDNINNNEITEENNSVYDSENNTTENSSENNFEEGEALDNTETSGEETAKSEDSSNQNKETKKKGKKNKKDQQEFSLVREILSWVKIFVIAVVIAFVVNNVIIMNANVPSGSMLNTIQIGDRMIGLRTAYWFSDPQRGDIVIFENPDFNENSPSDEKYYVKRVIGLPGDKVVIKNANIYINDSKTPLEEPYLPEEWTEVNGSDEPLTYNVPEDSYFMLGDNRNRSSDARYWTNTFVKRDGIIAKAEFKYWSQGKVDVEKFEHETYSIDNKSSK